MSNDKVWKRKHRMLWSDEEQRILHRTYGKLSLHTISGILERTPDAIKSRAASRMLGYAAPGWSPWTKEEEDILLTYYANGESIAQVLKRLPGRNQSAVNAHCQKLGISSPYYWRDDEIAILKQHYTAIGTRVVAMLPGRTVKSVMMKALKMKLRYEGGHENSSGHKRWSPEERARLELHLHLKLSELVKLFPDRTTNGVQMARVKLQRKLRKASEK